MNVPRNLSLKDRTDYLVHRRFPFARALEFPPSLTTGRSRIPGPSREARQALATFRTELAALSPDDLIARYDTEKRLEYEQAVETSRQAEQKLIFNQPHSVADFEHWSKLAHWTLDEAVALSFGKAQKW